MLVVSVMSKLLMVSLVNFFCNVNIILFAPLHSVDGRSCINRNNYETVELMRKSYCTMEDKEGIFWRLKRRVN